jgi:hypothetical protein
MIIQKNLMLCCDCFVVRAALVLVDDATIKDHTPLRTMGRSRKRTTDHAETDTPRKSSRGEGSMESTFLGSQLMMFGTQQGKHL